MLSCLVNLPTLEGRDPGAGDLLNVPEGRTPHRFWESVGESRGTHSYDRGWAGSDTLGEKHSVLVGALGTRKPDLQPRRLLMEGPALSPVPLPPSLRRLSPDPCFIYRGLEASLCS